MSRDFTYQAAFSWNSSLSQSRQEDIISWIKNMSEEEYKLLDDLLSDTRAALRDDCDDRVGSYTGKEGL